MAIDAARWPEVTALFGELADLPPSVRAQRLAALTDAALRDEVQSLLEADSQVGERFERAVAITRADETTSRRPLSFGVPETVGGWRIVRHLGDGGMGTVFEAVRVTDTFTQRAALKMINARGATNPALVQRFEAEGRILARLSHRNIATFLDGGVHHDGRPWFALEYVEGQQLVHWCTDRQLDTRARVQLLRQACSAVQYAHEHLVVHRDIKPANMLVAADGTLKLLDFGIARLTDDSSSPLTEVGVAPMTAAYASPEQRAGRTVTTATDIWSLGVVLYEVLTGTRPDTGASGDSTPMLPSARLSTTERASTDPRTRKRDGHTLRGELDAIVMMCLRPEPDRRYSSAAELGRDLQRWLEGRTVLARPDTLRYRLTMLVRRNKLATVATLSAVLALVSGVVVSTAQTRVARRERDRARLEQVRTERVVAFFQQVLGTAAPVNGGRSISVGDALTRAIPVIDTAFTREPDIKAAVQLSVGSTLLELQQNDGARPLLTAAYEYFRTHDGPTTSRDQTDAMWDLATLATRDGRLADAESLYVRLAALYRRGEYEQNDWVNAGLRIAGLRVDAGDLSGAVAAYDSLLPKYHPVTREDSQSFAALVGSRGTSLATLGAFDRAVGDFSRAMSMYAALSQGDDSYAVGLLLQPYAAAMLFTGKTAQAESLARRAVAIARREFSDGAEAPLSAQRMLGTVLVAEQKCSEAVRTFSDILAFRGRTLSDNNPTVGYSLVHRGYCRAQLGDVRGGVTDARDGVRLTREAVGDTHYAYHLAQSLAGATLAAGDASLRPQARAWLEAGAAGLHRTLAPTHMRVRDADARLTAFRAAHPAP